MEADSTARNSWFRPSYYVANPRRSTAKFRQHILARCVAGLETDDGCFHITEDPIHVHDLQAAILNRTRLTYHYMAATSGLLTDVEGNVVKKLLALGNKTVTVRER